MKRYLLLILILSIITPVMVMAQRTATVEGSYTYVVGENDNITLREAKLKCVELAKAEAIKAEFGELITSDVIDTNVETNGEATSSYFWENTVAMAKGDWLGDTKAPEITVTYDKGKLIFHANVKGKAREIIQAKADLKWSILKDGNDKKVETSSFNSGERIYMQFRSPSAGYVAVYLIVGDETVCIWLRAARTTCFSIKKQIRWPHIINSAPSVKRRTTRWWSSILPIHSPSATISRATNAIPIH